MSNTAQQSRVNISLELALARVLKASREEIMEELKKVQLEEIGEMVIALGQRLQESE